MIILFLLAALLLFPAYSVSADKLPEFDADVFTDHPIEYTYDPADEEDLLTWETGLGAAVEPDGNIVLISIFLSDDQNFWDFQNPQDVYTRNDCLDYLGIATDWITQNAHTWGKDPRFIYNWSEDIRLYYEADISGSVTAYDDPTEEMADFIDHSVNVDKLLEDYEADSVVFMAFVNTPLHSWYPSYTIPYDDEAVSPYEIVYLLTGCNGEEENPATYAHEILHVFGAPDLYPSGNPVYNYKIDHHFTKYCETYYPNEIMLTTCDGTHRSRIMISFPMNSRT